MVKTTVINEINVARSARVMQIEGLFDVPATERSRVELEANLPLDDQDWSIGLIVGPSGVGKSSIARNVFGDAYMQPYDWPRDKSILDAFPEDTSIKDITAMLSGVGFGSPPSWVRPYHALSTGEQFRVDMARAIMSTDDLVVVDEFTSVVDRQIAQVASHAVQKAVRRSNRRLVAVSCHYDIVDWLQPDWVYQPQADVFDWRLPQRHPPIDLEVYAIDRSAWRVFAPFHYLSHDLASAAQCFGAFLPDGQCIAFTSYLHFPHPNTKTIKLGHRLVVLPDWQGLGIAGRLDDWLGEYLHERGFRYRNVVASPAMIAHYSRSPRWQLDYSGFPPASVSKRKGLRNRHNKLSARRSIASFEYVPERKKS